MSQAILHHCGDGNVPPVRVLSTWVLAMRDSSSAAHVFLGVDGPESRDLERLLGTDRVTVVPGAKDTIDEIVVTMPAVLASGARVLYISTEPGHVGRAAIAACILYWRRGVAIRPAPSEPGAYRSPWHLTVTNVIRALWIRATTP